MAVAPELEPVTVSLNVNVPSNGVAWIYVLFAYAIDAVAFDVDPLTISFSWKVDTPCKV